MDLDLKRYNPLVSPKVRRHGWILVLFALVGGGFGFMRTMRKPVNYESSAKMYVTGRVILADTPSGFAEELANYLGTQIEIMRSEQIHQRSLQRLALGGQPTDQDGQLMIDVAENTTVLELRCLSGDATFARVYLDAVMDEFIDFKRDQRMALSQNTLEQISAEIARLEGELQTQEKAFFDFRVNNNIGFWEQQSTASASFLNELKGREAKLKLELSLIDNWRRFAADGKLDPSMRKMGSPATTENSISSSLGSLQSLRNELKRLTVERELRLRSLRPAHPIVQKLDREIERQQLLVASIDEEVGTAEEGHRLALVSELASVREAITEWENKALESSRVEAEYQKLNDARTRTKELYDRLVGSLRSVDVGRGVDQERVQILQPASVPVALAPNYRRETVNGAFVGGFLGWALLWLLIRTDDRAYTLEMAVDALKVPALGEVPHLSGSRVSGRRSRYERSAFEESFRRMRSLLVSGWNYEKAPIWLVTSSLASEGKTEVTANLGRALAASGKRVLLVDADLRRGRLAGVFSEIPADAKGLRDYLRDHLTADAVVRPTGEENLSVVVRGAGEDSAAELLSGKQLTAQIDALRSGFDVVLIDSAPIGPVDDTSSILPLAEKVLYVVRAGRTHLHTVEANLQRLRGAANRSLQLVVNDVRSHLSSKYYSYYR